MTVETKLLALILGDIDQRISEATRYQEYERYNESMPGFWVYNIPQKKYRNIFTDEMKPYEDDPDYMPQIKQAQVHRWGTSNVLMAFAYAPEIDTVIFKYLPPPK